VAAAGPFLVSAICGCTMTAVPPTAADRNRERVIELENEVDLLNGRVAELEAALRAAELETALRAAGQASIRADGQPMPADVLATAPFAVRLDLGRFGGLIDADSDDRPDGVRLYLQPRDGRGEVVQVAGRATVDAVWLDEEGNATALGRAELDPAQWREAFRSGFMGTHYTVELPFTSGLLPPGAGGSVIVRVSLSDGLTGRELAAESLHTLPRLPS